MLKRIVSAAVLTVMGALVIFGQLYIPVIFTVAAALLGVIAACELSSAVGFRDSVFYTAVSAAASAGIVFSVGTKLVWLCLFAYITAVFVCQLFLHEKYEMKNVLTLCAMTVLVSFALGSGVILRNTDKKLGIIIVMLGVLSAWMSDVGGYFGGYFFGKRKLCPKISPKKTVEGVIGGFVLNLIFMFAARAVIKSALNVSFKILPLILLSLGGTVISIVGDLSFSLIKREFGIKDYGKLIPGHGGVLDRFDGVVFTLPFTYLLFSALPFV